MTTLNVPITREAIEQRRDQIEQHTHAGLTAAQIADILGISERTVVRARRARGCQQGPPPRPMTAEEINQAREMLDDGCSYAEVARSLGRSSGVIRRLFPGRGWPRGAGGRFGQERRRAEAVIAQMYATSTRAVS